jgi:CO/xanthine dehydrogenase Mo-binding subunit
VLFNSGAYAAFKPTPMVNLGDASHAPGRTVFRTSRLMPIRCTPTVCQPAMRAPGDPQVTFAVESAMDMMAAEFGLDPLAFRRMNLL